MTNKVIRVFGQLLIFLMFAHTSFGCTLIVQPVTQFDPSEFIFASEVVSYVGPIKPKYVVGEAWGLMVRVRTSVHLPKTPVRHFEVFPYELDADCSSLGISEEKLIQSYPIGSKVLVVAKESKLDAAEDGNVRLVISPGSNGLLSVVKDAEMITSASSAYDYRAYEEIRSALPVFELRKDLLRLREARSEKERVTILKRLVCYPQRFIIDYAKIAELHLKNRRIISQLIEEREAWKAPHNNLFNPTPR